MGHQSIITGYVLVADFSAIEMNMKVISSYPFDVDYPFTNIFWGGSPAQYFTPIIGIVGAYRGIEEDWNEWLWKYCQLLSKLEAFEAKVHLDCAIGEWTWTLQPESWFRHSTARGHSFRGQRWGIAVAPENDFSLKDPWNKKWPKTVQRWVDENHTRAQDK